jgi:hypothetical protein
MITILKLKEQPQSCSDNVKAYPDTKDPLTYLSELIDGWIIATDIPNARYQVDPSESALHLELYQLLESPPRPGKYVMQTPGYLMLVS